MLPQDAENVRELPQRRPSTPEEEPVDTTGFPLSSQATVESNPFFERTNLFPVFKTIKHPVP